MFSIDLMTSLCKHPAEGTISPEKQKHHHVASDLKDISKIFLIIKENSLQMMLCKDILDYESCRLARHTKQTNTIHAHCVLVSSAAVSMIILF